MKSQSSVNSAELKPSESTSVFMKTNRKTQLTKTNTPELAIESTTNFEDSETVAANIGTTEKSSITETESTALHSFFSTQSQSNSQSGETFTRQELTLQSSATSADLELSILSTIASFKTELTAQSG